MYLHQTSLDIFEINHVLYPYMKILYSTNLEETKLLFAKISKFGEKKQENHHNKCQLQ